MSLAFGNLIPGQQASRESVEKRVLWGPPDSYVTTGAVLDSTTVDARSTVTTELLPGLLLGKITSSSKWVNYSATATDGSNVVQGVLGVPVNMKNAAGTAVDQLAAVVVSGCVMNGELGGLNQKARADMAGRFLFDDDFLGNRFFGLRDVVAKTADYTVTVADNGTCFTNAGASGTVVFTLPTIAKGLRYNFYVEADQTVTVASVVADTMVTFNDAAADSVSFSTSSEKIGGRIEVFANAAGTKWLTTTFLAIETQTPVVAT